MRIAIIPAYEPPDGFIEYAKKLSNTVDRLLVVDDGSGAQYAPIFDRISQIPNAIVISYPENRGKGHALKQAYAYCAEHFHPEDIVVTADCDGQHSLEDVLSVCRAAENEPNAYVLGVRNFTAANVPKRSLRGNTMMLRFLRLLYGIRVTDSQTGLRACSVETAGALLGVSGDRFEYETGVLIFAKRNHIPLREVVIQTIYPEKNKEHITHFRTFRDGCRVIGTLLRYLLPGSCQPNCAPRFYGKFGRFARWLLRTFSRRYAADIPAPKEPVVYVCRHLNMHGPFSTLKWLPFHVHPMIIHMYFDREETVRHMTRYTFAERYGRKPKKFNLAAHVMGFVAPPMMKSLQAIPVYRDSNSISTMKKGLQYLLKGESLIVYPDIEYTAGYDHPSEIYSGFLMLGDLYRRKAGKPLSFVPLIVEDDNRRITAGVPVNVSSYKAEGKAAAAYLKNTINIKRNSYDHDFLCASAADQQPVCQSQTGISQ